MKPSFNTVRQREQSFRLVLILLLSILGIYSCSVHAQGVSGARYFGLETSFGNRAFNLNSDIKAIDNARFGHVGGSIGFVAGNEFWKSRTQVFGYYFSDSNNPHTEDLYESSSLINFYPLESFRTNRAILHPYFTAGLSGSIIKYYGSYLKETEALMTRNEPFVGRTINFNAVAGLGFEMRIESDISFVHVFTEYLFAKNLSTNTNQDVLKNTTMNGMGSFSIGVSFGCKKL